ncbi:amidohydrolase 2 [Pholiota molesta]|nr:amidohydrolase 2 [Pholiota molesta]
MSHLKVLQFTLSLTREWRDTGTGTIVLEEAWTIPELVDQAAGYLIRTGGTPAELRANLLDIHNQRLDAMNKNDIDLCMVLSCASPCIQGIADPEEASQMAITVNNRLAAAISNNTQRFGAFASLAMQNATVAVAELKRTVKNWVFSVSRVLLNDYQQSGSDGLTPLYYDQPEYDIFWQALTDLDVPLFASQGKINCRSLGERIPSDFVRINHELLKQLPFGLPMKKTIMYSIDYPFQNIPDGTVWVNTLPEILQKEGFASFSRELAIKILHLND